jgi:hypothetical protein
VTAHADRILLSQHRPHRALLHQPAHPQRPRYWHRRDRAWPLGRRPARRGLSIRQWRAHR